jgi:16S rRNA (uracil1498-N3)-methyltransferase
LDGLQARRRAAAHVFVSDVEVPVLDQRDRHHVLGVLRVRPGQHVSVADGTGRWRLCALASGRGGDRDGGGGDGGGDGRGDNRRDHRRDDRIDHRLEPVSPVVAEPEELPALTVALAPTKGERPAWAVGKLTELGIDRIVPLVTARSVVRWDDKSGDRRHERWTEVARQAAMQSRRVRLPVIDPPMGVAAVAAMAGTGAAMAVPGGEPPTLDRSTVLIGPEGGWSPDEESAVPAAVGLGPLVLRTETAAVVAGSLYAALRAGLVVRASAGSG